MKYRSGKVFFKKGENKIQVRESFFQKMWKQNTGPGKFFQCEMWVEFVDLTPNADRSHKTSSVVPVRSKMIKKQKRRYFYPFYFR